MAPLEFDEKARENLDAVHRLLPDESGREALSNAVANRAYYAAYLAAAHIAQARRIAFTAGNEYYQHDTFPDVARSGGVLDAQRAADLRYLYGMRVKADHSEDNVDFEEADVCANVAEELVAQLLGERR
ncbi:MAG: hypothetical protein ACRELY_31550 [Polyangiaceae bacterium]